MDYAQLILGMFAIAIGAILFRKVFHKHKRIDTESVAIVKEVQELGRDDGKKVYAIRYGVQSSEPFDIIETPCKKVLPIGKERVIFYEKNDESKGQPGANFYFKTIKQFDRRFVAPCLLILFGAILLLSTIVNVFA